MFRSVRAESPARDCRRRMRNIRCSSSYIDVVVEGGLEYGDAFAREAIETTSDWSDYWLNDRELARRPWVRDPGSAAVDKLLSAAPDAAAKLKSRLFSEPYAIHWAVQKAQ